MSFIWRSERGLGTFQDALSEASLSPEHDRSDSKLIRILDVKQMAGHKMGLGGTHPFHSLSNGSERALYLPNFERALFYQEAGDQRLTQHFSCRFELHAIFQSSAPQSVCG
jgi:hypothetical protein